MFGIGTVCMKIAGRDAGKTCVVVEEAKNGIVVIEGATRRRKCNVKHLEPLGRSIEMKTGASHEQVMKALGLTPKVSKPKKAGAKPSAHAKRIKPKVPVDDAPKKAKK